MIEIHHEKRHILPFTAIVGQENMKKALILNAINQKIGGVLIRGKKGCAKSTAVRALEPGILAAANRGILYIDEVNLLVGGIFQLIILHQVRFMILLHTSRNI